MNMIFCVRIIGIALAVGLLFSASGCRTVYKSTEKETSVIQQTPVVAPDKDFPK